MKFINKKKKYTPYKGDKNKGFENIEYLEVISKIIGLDDECFSGYDNLKEVILNKSLEFIGSRVFSSLKHLKSLTIPNRVYEIGEACFSGCEGLECVTLSENLTSISNELFKNCSSIAELRIPRGVVKIGSNVFNGCANLKELCFLCSTPPTLLDNFLDSLPPDCVIYALNSDSEKYFSDDTWSRIASKIVFVEEF